MQMSVIQTKNRVDRQTEDIKNTADVQVAQRKFSDFKLQFGNKNMCRTCTRFWTEIPKLEWRRMFFKWYQSDSLLNWSFLVVLNILLGRDLVSLIRRFDDCVRTCEIPFTKRDDMRDSLLGTDDASEPWSRQWSWRKGKAKFLKFLKFPKYV